MKRLSLAIITLLACAGAQAASEKVVMNLVTSQGVGQRLVRSLLPNPQKGWSLRLILKHCHRVNMVFMCMLTAVANPLSKRVKPQQQNRLAVIMIRIKLASMKVRKAQVTWVTCHCWW